MRLLGINVLILLIPCYSNKVAEFSEVLKPKRFRVFNKQIYI